MEELKEIISQYIWLLCQWWFWIAFVVGMILYWYLLRQRTYKEVDGKLFIRHGKLGKWLDIKEHLKTEHPLEYELYKQSNNKEGEIK